ncbi:MAG: hypothetical protein OXT69_00325 [Candidatus Poribacteria bacterium]|nr:hypothetical protein [Candidatus Poribacteria bacterium]
MFYTFTISALIFLATTVTAFGQEKNQEMSRWGSLILLLGIAILLLFGLAIMFMKYKLIRGDQEFELQRLKNEDDEKIS